MNFLIKMLVLVDSLREQLGTSSKRNADDYYELVSPVSSNIFKMNDGSFVSFFELRGAGRILSESEKRHSARQIEKSLKGIMSRPGYSIQIVDSADPDMTKYFVAESMKDSINELKNIGLHHDIFTKDYLDFVAANSVWRKQYIVIQTTALSLKKMSDGSKGKKVKAEVTDSVVEKSDVLDNVMKTKSGDQSVVLVPKEIETLKNHRSFYKLIMSALADNLVIVEEMFNDDAICDQKRMIYGKGDLKGWKPSFDSVSISKSAENSDTKGQVKLAATNLSNQVIDQGGTEKDLPPDVFRFGDRYFSTISMTLPQQNEDKMDSYSGLLSKLPKKIGVLVSSRITSSPYSYSSYNVEQNYTGMSSVFPGSGNRIIKLAREEMRRAHEDGDNVSVYLQLTITFYSTNMNLLMDSKREALDALGGFNSAKFRTVSLDKTQGLFDSLPGASKKSHLNQVMENLADALFQSPIFGTGILYNSGYFHLFTDDDQPYPIEEHSSKNMSYNSYICGTTGGGKSTLLAMLNMALLAKPKNNPRLRGELPVIMDVDFGKTSFGSKLLMKRLIGKEKEHLFLVHEMSTSIKSALNPHDLPLGRTKPTERHKGLLVNFLSVLISGVEKVNGTGDDAGRFKLIHPGISDMIMNLVVALYDNTQESANPKMFSKAEFRHERTVRFMASIGLTPSEHYSYYTLADIVMEKEPVKGIEHAKILRRYAVPKLSDYALFLADNDVLRTRYNSGNIDGKTYSDFFIERVSSVLREFPCFSRPSVLSFDSARMISIDIEAVCGDSDYRKAVFSSLMMMSFFSKRENSEESEDLYKDVKPVYLPYLKKMSTINRVLPGTFNIEEAHMLFDLFDDQLVSVQRRNRKRGWGIRTLSQRITDPSDKLFSLTANVYVTTEETGEKVEKRLRSIQASSSEKEIVNSGLTGRRFFMYIRTKPENDEQGKKAPVSRIGVRLNPKLSPGMLWFSSAEQVDIGFRDDLIEHIGEDLALKRLSVFFKQGSVRSLFESTRLKKLAAERGEDSVYSLLMSELKENDQPSAMLLSHF